MPSSSPNPFLQLLRTLRTRFSHQMRKVTLHISHRTPWKHRLPSRMGQASQWDDRDLAPSLPQPDCKTTGKNHQLFTCPVSLTAPWVSVLSLLSISGAAAENHPTSWPPSQQHRCPCSLRHKPLLQPTSRLGCLRPRNWIDGSALQSLKKYTLKRSIRGWQPPNLLRGQHSACLIRFLESI